MGIRTTSSFRNLPDQVRSQRYHFRLMMEFDCACPILFLGGPDCTQFMMDNLIIPQLSIQFPLRPSNKAGAVFQSCLHMLVNHCFEILRASALIHLRPSRGSKNHPDLLLMPKEPLLLLNPAAPSVRHPAQQPGPAAEPSVILGPTQNQQLSHSVNGLQ